MKSFEIASQVKPTERQISWQNTEYYALVCYGMNTFTQKDIGEGFTGPNTFFPENIDTDQWAETIKDGAMNGLVLTAKHYDGFCNWPTETTDYSVKSSIWENGKGDIVKMAADSARKAGLKFGLYIPVWDRHEKSFKKSDGSFNKFFLAQLKELLTSYGDLFMIWLDDRCDETMAFDFDYASVYRTIRELQPDCAITFRGPDGRWVGNNRGVTRPEEWCVVPASYGFGENGEVLTSQKQKKTTQMELDIGSRKAVKKETEFIWYPCEVNYPIRSHWFYRKDDDYTVKTKDKLLNIYNRTVGNNSNLILGLAPDKRGKIADTDIQILKSTGHDLRIIFGYNLLKDGDITASSSLSGLYKPENIIADNDSFWCPDKNDKEPYITIKFHKTEMFDKVILKEHIRNGQKAEDFTVYIDVKGKWKKFSEGKSIGHKKICSERPVETSAVKIVFEKYRAPIEISLIQIN
ncbi:MAG: alpha-L-fucosidase [Clostridiales bacterium]|nr:alpha-L-fucosidase [Clostridiales bacterium]